MREGGDAAQICAHVLMASNPHQEDTKRTLSGHERFMLRALQLAERGRGTTSPNPLVGCVLVKTNDVDTFGEPIRRAHDGPVFGAVVGEGWHERAGEDHAEVMALKAAEGAAKGATAYVTLEPCAHHGQTPPCTDALIAAGVRRVVIGTLDPDPRVQGRGVQALEAAGIEVIQGVLEEEAQAQNEAFFTSQQRGRPFILYKTAMTLDGKIATRAGHSRWITGEESRELVQGWRSELDAVIVGVNTVLLDDPLLTARIEGGRTPTKVIFDSVARTPSTARLFEADETGQAPKVVIFVGPGAPADRKTALEQAGAEVLTIDGPNGRPSVLDALAQLHERKLRSALLEGGGTLAWSFLEAQAIDRVAWFVGPKLLGGNGATPLGGFGVARMEDAYGLTDLQATESGPDLLITARVTYPNSSPEEEGE